MSLGCRKQADIIILFRVICHETSNHSIDFPGNQGVPIIVFYRRRFMNERLLSYYVRLCYFRLHSYVFIHFIVIDVPYLFCLIYVYRRWGHIFTLLWGPVCLYKIYVSHRYLNKVQRFGKGISKLSENSIYTTIFWGAYE